ncbi:hypothetical protein OCV51_10230 [Faecalicatena acetigenes]|uniref:DNA primase n=1 Tax=Faecalicatena acetigenes TaxID=2981790 RepID=A0ABT2TCM0_9FIRM|nr:hypothetical protein [Faecalicatena acetigenes]MCU6748023.1 hypothetical protein [Faecalicatena acetigenes]SCI22129.1 Uncharacterised protein [uncultured Clostridium sp.]
MIKEFIDSVGAEKLEETALLWHRPQNGIYIYVNEDKTYKVEKNWQKISFNSKHRGWDYYSQLVSINKPIAGKLIQSNNYCAFWCRNIAKLKEADIDDYFNVLHTPEEFEWHRDWIKENIYKLGKIYQGGIVKIFFPNTRELYRDLGLEYWRKKCTSVPYNFKNYKSPLSGVPIGYSVNVKKPFQTGRTPFLVTEEEGLQIKFVYDILKGCIKRGFNEIRATTTRGLYVTRTCDPLGIDLPPSMLLIIDLNERGEVVIKRCEAVPNFRNRL